MRKSSLRNIGILLVLFSAPTVTAMQNGFTPAYWVLLAVNAVAVALCVRGAIHGD